MRKPFGDISPIQVFRFKLDDNLASISSNSDHNFARIFAITSKLSKRHSLLNSCVSYADENQPPNEMTRHRPRKQRGIIMAQAAKSTKSSGLDREFLTDLGEVVRRRRLALNLSQEELASRAGVHRTYLSDIERGARNITVTVLARIAEALEVKVSRLFRLTEDNGYEQPKKSRSRQL